MEKDYQFKNDWIKLSNDDNLISIQLSRLTRLFVFTLIFSCNFLFSQMVQLGSGTATNTTLPINSCWGFSYTQQIYNATLIGGQSGLIEKIRFFYVSGNTTESLNWRILMGHTNQNDFQSTTSWVPFSSLTEVFNGNVVYPAAGNWMEITLATPFLYDGSSNLVIAVDENTPGWHCSITWRSFTGATNTGMSFISDTVNPTPENPPTASTRVNTLPQVQLEFIPANACSGTPTPGNTLSSQPSVCPSSNFTLSFQNNVAASGFTFQWQSSNDNGANWTNIIGANSASYGASQTSPTTYRCRVTCDGNDGFSTPLLVGVNDFLQCYCPGVVSNAGDTDIGNVTFAGINNGNPNPTFNNPAATGQFSNFTASVAPGQVVVGQTYPISISQITSSGTFYAAGANVFIDYNRNGVFEANERVLFSGPTGPTGSAPITTVLTGNITIPVTAQSGLTRMRVMLIEGGTNTDLPCNIFAWGEIEDYLVNIVGAPDAPPAPVQSALPPTCSNGTELTVAAPTAPNVVFYWQSTANGTSFDSPATQPWVVFVNGTYFVRAYDNSTQVWSMNSSPVTVSNFPLAPAPPAPVAAANPACQSTLLTVPVSTDPNIAFFWQGTVEGGTSSALPATAPFEVTQSGTYYVAAFDSSTSCWSATQGISVTISNDVPDAPTAVQSSFDVCVGATSILLEANGVQGPQLAQINLISNGNFNGIFNQNFTGQLNLPSGSVITNVALKINGLTTTAGAWASDLRVGLTGGVTLPLTTPEGLGVTNVNFTYPATFVNTGAFTLNFQNVWGGGVTVNSIVLEVSYTVPPVTIRWFDAPTGGTLLATSNTFEAVGSSVLPNANIGGTYTFYAESFGNPCSSTRIPVTVVLTAVRANLTAVDASCNGVADGTFTLGTVECGVEPFTYSLDNGVSFGPIPTNLAAGDYSVIIKDATDATSSPVSIVINQPDEIINAPVGQNAVSCVGTDSVTISATASSSVLLSETLTLPIATNATFTQSQTVNFNGTLNLPAGSTVTSAQLVFNGITTTGGGWLNELILTSSGSVIFPTTPMSPTTGGVVNENRTYNVSVTGNGAFTVSVENIWVADATAQSISLVVNYNLPSTVSVSWWDAPTGGNLLGNGSLEAVGTSVLANTNVAGVYTFYAQGENNGCSSATRTPITVTLNQTAAPTGLGIFQFCATSSATLSDIVVTGQNIQWYAAPAGGTALASSTPLTSGFLFASQTVNGCESIDRFPVFIFSNVVPNPTVSPLQQFCAGATVADLNASGSGLQWYATAQGGAALASDAVLASGNYFVSQTVNGCESFRSAVAVVITNVPAPQLQAQVFCGSASVADLLALGQGLSWFEDMSSDISLAASTLLASGTYFVEVTSGACTSDRVAVEVTILNTPAPLAEAQSFCFGSTISDLVADGSNLMWYASQTGGTPLMANTMLEDGMYYVSQTIDGCESERVAVVVSITTTPAPVGPTVQVLDEGSTVADLEAAGTDVVWYASMEDAMNGTNALDASALLEEGTYYAVQTVDGCTSAPLVVEVSIALRSNDFDVAALKVYPNPVIDVITIQYSSEITNVKVVNLMGQTLMQSNHNATMVNLSLGQLPAGSYMLMLESNTKNTVVKIVKR